jgi:hypothetical protein
LVDETISISKISNERKGRKEICRPLKSSKNLEWVFLPSDEPFNVLLRTSATNHRSSNGLHGETSISWTSPPSSIYILNLLSPPCQVINKRFLKKSRNLRERAEVFNNFQQRIDL